MKTYLLHFQEENGFSKIDLTQAYLQLEVDEESKKYLTINTHKGLYRYNRLLFRIASAPAIWQRTTEQILQGLEGVYCILDDMVITGKDDKQHLNNLSKVLQRVEEFNLRANKCYVIMILDYLFVWTMMPHHSG